MQLFALSLPLESIIPALQAMTVVVRPLVGILMACAFVLVFRPLLQGLLKAALLLISPRKSLPERRQHQTLRGVMQLHRMARDMEQSLPNMAAELRSFAARH